MAIKLKKQESSAKRELVPSGTHAARIVRIIEIGRTSYMYLGEEKHKHAVEITFELPTELRVFNEEKGEQPMVVSLEYNLSRYEKAKLMIHLGALENKVFSEDEMLDLDVASYIGRACMVTIVHKVSAKGNTYANVQGVSSVPKGLEVPPMINQPLVWDYDTNFALDVLNSFPVWLQDKIKETPEFKEKQFNDENDDCMQDDYTEGMTDNLPF